MRKIISLIIIGIFLIVVSYVGWILFDKIGDRSKREVNEDNAIKILREIYQGQIKAKEKYGKYISLDSLLQENLLNPELKNGKFSGYNFFIKLNEKGYSVNANRELGEGNVSFYLDETGVIRSSDKIIAGPNDIPSKLGNLVK